jgi:hypothetical protein
MGAVLATAGAMKLASGCRAALFLTPWQVCATALLEILAAAVIFSRWWKWSTAFSCLLAAFGSIMALRQEARSCGCFGDIALANWMEGVIAASLGLLGITAWNGGAAPSARDQEPPGRPSAR